VPSHAYAVLRVEKLGAHRFLLLKNPWAAKRWKGRFSADDDKLWTAQLRKALNYDPSTQKTFDSGIFWMCFEDVSEFFSALFVNWKPSLFATQITQHAFWSKNKGPKNDSVNLGYNPQFTLDVDASESAGSVWILLSKHMQHTKRHEQHKNDFLTLHCYGHSQSEHQRRDRRVFYRSEGEGALETGTYINSPHYLLKMDIDKTSTKQHFTVIVSQYEKKHDVSFSMTCFSTLRPQRIRFKPIEDAKLWKYQKALKGAWTAQSSGGAPSYDSFAANPRWKMSTFASQCHARFILEAPKEISVNVQLFKTSDAEQKTEEPSEEFTFAKQFLVTDSGPYRFGLAVADAYDLAPGTYCAIISTFKPNTMAPWKLCIKCTENVQIDAV